MTKVGCSRGAPRSTASQEKRHEAATKIQAAWRGQNARKDISVFAHGEGSAERVAASRSRILAHDLCPSITQTLAKASDVGRVRLGNVSREVARSLVDYLEGNEIYLGPKFASELLDVAERLEMPRLAEQLRADLSAHKPDEGWTAILSTTLGAAALMLRGSVEELKGIKATLPHPYGLGYASKVAESSVGKIRYLEAEGSGSLPTMIFVHGLSSSAVQCLSLLEELRPFCSRVVALDLPGHGKSETPADGLHSATVQQGSFDALDHIIGSRDRAVLIGNSLGGWVSGRYGLAGGARDRLDALVLISPAGTPMRLAERERLLDRWRPSNHSQARQFIEEFPMQGWMRPVAASAMRVRVSDPNLRSLVESAKDAKTFRRSDLANMRNLLVLWGTKDFVLPRAHRDFFASNLPAGASMIEPEMGHCPGLEDPKAIAGYIIDHATRALSLPTAVAEV